MLAIHLDEVLDHDAVTVLARLTVSKACDETCNPGNCEITHQERFGLPIGPRPRQARPNTREAT